MLGGWGLAGEAIVPSGSGPSIGDSNVFGMEEDRAQLTGNSTKSQLVRRAPIEWRLNGKSNASWFTTAPVIDADGIATGFGTRGTGILDGPLGQPGISRFRKLWCCC